jgi:hypothetical protein
LTFTELTRRIAMRSYEVEFQRTSYITVTVQAGNEDEAEEVAWAQLEADTVNINDADWKVESVEEIHE